MLKIQEEISFPREKGSLLEQEEKSHQKNEKRDLVVKWNGIS